MSWLLAFLVHGASAAPIVLHQSDEETVRITVSDLAGVSPSTLSVTHFDAFRMSMVEKWSGLGGHTACGGDSVTAASISESIASAESSLMYMELEPAIEALGKAQKDLVCLDSLVESDMAARVGFLQGVISTEEKDKGAAWEHFSRAIRYAPTLTWDDQFPTDGAALLELAKKELETAIPIEVTLTPSIPASEDEAAMVYLNASPIAGGADKLAVHVGENLLQVKNDTGVVGFVLNVEPESRPKLYLPQLLTSESIEMIKSEDGRSELSNVVNRSYEAGTPVYVVHDDGVWRTASGIGTWEALREPTGSAVVQRGGGAVSPMAWVGTGLTAGALTGTVVALMKAMKAGQAIDSASGQLEEAARLGDFDGAEAAQQSQEENRSARMSGYVGVGVGAALTVTGVVFTVPLF